MQDIYYYIPEGNHVSRVYSAEAVLQLQIVLHVMLFPMLDVLYCSISTLRSKYMCIAQHGSFPYFLDFVSFQACCSGIFIK